MKQTDEEILDLVDENDDIIGEVGRSVANSNPKFIHREVGIMVLDKKGRTLFSKRSKKKKKDPGYWNFGLGGHVGKGESPKGAAQRELLEELGIGADLKFVRKWLSKGHDETRFFYEYLFVWQGEEIRPDSDEVEEVRFLDHREFEELVASGEKISETTMKLAKDYWAGRFGI